MPSTHHGLAFVGDFLPGSSPPALARRSSLALIGNLETSIGRRPARSGKAYSVALPPEALDAPAIAEFAAVSVANNHTYDSGTEGFQSLVRGLEDRGVCAYGRTGRPYVELSVGAGSTAVIGCLEPCRSRGALIFPEERTESLVRRLAGRFDAVFVTPHWGKEGEYAFFPSPRQRRLAADWLRAGATAVLGHHPHTLHGRERVGDTRVYYSLGNAGFVHEEGREWPLTGLGVAVIWRASTPREAPRWSEVFLWQTQQGLVELTGEPERAAVAFLASISDRLSQAARSWSTRDWARTVGRTYVTKSRASWRRRWRTDILRTLPAWALWSLDRRTRLLAWGASREEHQWRDSARKLELALSRHTRQLSAETRRAQIGEAGSPTP